MKRLVIITGVASGIGKATSQVFASEGWYVVGVDRKDAHGSDHIDCFIQADVACATEWGRVTHELNKRNVEVVDALVNNAAVQVCRPLLDTSLEDWELIMSSNVYSVCLATRAVYPLMKAGSAIINVSSVHALATSKNLAAYATSKGALLSLTRAMAIEFAHNGIRVNAVLPGSIDTPMLRASLIADCPPEDQQDIADLLQLFSNRQVMGRLGKPEEIGQAVLFLADIGRSAFITGQALIVDGGATARLSTADI